MILPSRALLIPLDKHPHLSRVVRTAIFCYLQPLPGTGSLSRSQCLSPTAALRLSTKVFSAFHPRLVINQRFSPDQTILHQWQRLASRSLKSANFRQITNLIDDEENRKVALTFRGGDAATVIDTINKVGQVQHFVPTAEAHSFRFSMCRAAAEGRSTSTCDQASRFQTDADPRRTLTSSPETLPCWHIRAVQGREKCHRNWLVRGHSKR